MALLEYLEAIFKTDKSPFESAIMEPGDEPDQCLLHLRLQELERVGAPEIVLLVDWNSGSEIITFTLRFTHEHELDPTDERLFRLINAYGSRIGITHHLSIIQEGERTELVSIAAFLVLWPESDNVSLTTLMRTNIANFIVQGAADSIDFFHELETPPSTRH